MYVKSSGSWPPRAALVSLSLLLAPARASKDIVNFVGGVWWTPADSFVQVYDIFGEDSGAVRKTNWPDAERSSQVKASPQADLVLLGEGSQRARENATTQLHKVNGSTLTVTSSQAQGKVDQVKVNATSVVSVNATAADKQIPIEVRKTWLEWVRALMSFAFVVKTMCMMSNILFQASPLPVMKGFALNGNTGDADSAPFISIAYGSCQWCFYGLFAFVVTQKSGFLVLVYSNVAGAALGMYYVYIFQTNCTNTEVRRRSSFYYKVLGAVAAVQVAGMAVMPPVRALFFSGLISSAWAVVGSMAMLTTVPVVLRTRCSKTLPLPILIAAQFSTVLWITCGVMLRDPWITVPNVASFCTCGFALALCWVYPSCSAGMDDEEEAEESAPLLDETANAGEQLLSNQQSPLMCIIRSIRGNEAEQRPVTMAGYGTLKRTASQEISAGTGETF